MQTQAVTSSTSNSAPSVPKAETDKKFTFNLTPMAARKLSSPYSSWASM